MSYSSGTNITSSNQFTGVLRLVDHWLAVHVQGSCKACISKHPEEDIKVAQVAAKTFADSHHIPYEENILEMDRPLMTVLKIDADWYPAEFHPDKISLLTHYGNVKLGGTQSEAINMAQAIASRKKRDCIPSIGISMENKTPLTD